MEGSHSGRVRLLVPIYQNYNFDKSRILENIIFSLVRRDRIVVECACLESKYTARYRGFESRSLRTAENMFSGESNPPAGGRKVSRAAVPEEGTKVSSRSSGEKRITTRF